MIAYAPPRGRPIMHEVCRINFDNHLKDFAVDAGAEFLERRKVTRISVRKDRVAVSIGDGHDLDADMVFGATSVFDQAARLVRKHAGLPETWSRDELGVVVEYEFPVGE